MSTRSDRYRMHATKDGAQLASTSHGRPSVQLWSTDAAWRLLRGESYDAIFQAAERPEADSDEEPKKKRRKKKGVVPGGLRTRGVVGLRCGESNPAKGQGA